MLYGWAGLILRVDLSREKIVKRVLPKDLATYFLGGAGINAKILYDEVDPKIDPFDPENRLIYGTGPLNGTLAPTCSRLTVTSKGPFTFAFSDSNCGGNFSSELKFAGYDHIVIQGRAKGPVYLLIDDENIEIRDASHLWGKDAWETDDIIREELGDPDIKTSVMGPAGEKLVRYAVPINEKVNVPGWGGQGSVMGSKNLKAVAVRGTGAVKIAKPKEFEEACIKARDMIINSERGQQWKKYGKTILNAMLHLLGESFYKNFSEPKIPDDLFPEMDHHRYLELVEKNVSCFNCPIGCFHLCKVKKGRWKGTVGVGYEYTHQKSVQAMGAIDRNFALVWCNETNRLGVDTAASAYAISWAMECVEKGILKKEDVDGIDLVWGNQDAALEMLKKITYREGFGDLLAEGVRIASQRIGKGSENFAMHIRGLSTAHDPRISWLAALSFATSTRGADHLKGNPMSDEFVKWKRKELETFSLADLYKYNYAAEAVIFHENLHSIIDAVELCKNVTASMCSGCPGYPEIAEMLSHTTGINFRPIDLMKIGERIYNVEAAFNAKCGVRIGSWTWPKRFFDERRTDIKMEVPFTRENFEKLKEDYCRRRGWDHGTGIPTREKLSELGLVSVADDVYRYLEHTGGRK